MSTDQDIVARILSGDARHYSVLVERYKNRAFALSCRLLGSREEAEEAVQDAFVRAFRSLTAFRGESQFGTWFYKILYNLCMTRLSRRQRPSESLDEVVMLEGEGVVESEELNVLERLGSKERYAILNAELQKLPERYRAVLMLFYVQEQRYEEIAEILAVPLSSVKTHLFRGRVLLRKRMLERYNKEVRAA
jgi:RNA polymerase sigma-70 factor (ECF subfamily)